MARFLATVVPSGNATAVAVPDIAMQALGGDSRPPVVVTVNGHSWRSRIARMRGLCLIGISAANREAAGIAEGDTIELDVSLDEEPREVIVPADLAAALDRAPGARGGFERLPFGLRNKHVNAIEGAKSADVRQRRIDRLVASLRDG